MQEQHTFLKGTVGYPDCAVVFHPSPHPRQPTGTAAQQMLLKNVRKESTQQTDRQAEVSTPKKRLSGACELKLTLEQPQAKPGPAENPPPPLLWVSAAGLQEHRLLYALLCELTHPRLLLDTARLQNSEMRIPRPSCSSNPLPAHRFFRQLVLLPQFQFTQEGSLLKQRPDKQ